MWSICSGHKNNLHYVSIPYFATISNVSSIRNVYFKFLFIWYAFKNTHVNSVLNKSCLLYELIKSNQMFKICYLLIIYIMNYFKLLFSFSNIVISNKKIFLGDILFFILCKNTIWKYINMMSCRKVTSDITWYLFA